MTKGISCPCPNPKCRKIVLRYCNFKGEGEFQTLCPHCDELVSVKLKMEQSITVTKVIVMVLLILIPLSFYTIYKAGKYVATRELYSELASQNLEE